MGESGAGMLGWLGSSFTGMAAGICSVSSSTGVAMGISSLGVGFGF